MNAIKISANATQAIEDIFETIGRDNMEAVVRFHLAVEKTCELLATHPNIGTLRESTKPEFKGIRSITVNSFRNYLIFFLSVQDEVRIIRVFHGARDADRWLNR
jgi:toxin ParE1/3/4